MPSSRCKNCHQKISGNFCSNCGQSAHEHRINATYFLHDIPHSIFHVDKGFFFTLKGLFTRPGVVVEEYLDGKRAKYFPPLAYVMVITAFSTYFVKLVDWIKLQLLQNYIPGFENGEHVNFFQHYFSLFIFLMIPFASLITNLFFIRKKYNFWEHLIANTYIAAQLNFMWMLIHLLNLLVVMVKKGNFAIDFEIFQMIFMMFFLYLYGSVFGYLMNRLTKRGVLILLLLCMNFCLFCLYSFGFKLAGFFD